MQYFFLESTITCRQPTVLQFYGRIYNCITYEMPHRFQPQMFLCIQNGDKGRIFSNRSIARFSPTKM